MEILKGVLVIIHLIGFATVFGVALAQLPAAKAGRGSITPGIFHGLNTMFLTGILLVVFLYLLEEPVNNLKISIKLVVLLTMVALVLFHRKNPRVSAGTFGAIAALGVLNVAIAVLWR